MEKKEHKLSLVGLGPGNIDNLTLKAFNTLKDSDVIIGYASYIKLLKEIPELDGKNIIAFPMKTEEERCLTALELAKDADVCLVSSGDTGIYGLASLVLEIIDEENLNIELHIVPGITAAIACSSLVGAPLANDFCCINLSDQLTDFEIIKKRLEGAIEGDFVITLYNPSSKDRYEQFEDIIHLLIEKLGNNIPIAVVKNAYRENQETYPLLLKDLQPDEIDMNSLIIIGNSQTVINENNENVYTKRGYK